MRKFNEYKFVDNQNIKNLNKHNENVNHRIHAVVKLFKKLITIKNILKGVFETEEIKNGVVTSS